MNSSKQIKLGALISYFAIAFNIVAGLIYTPWMISKNRAEQLWALHTCNLCNIYVRNGFRYGRGSDEIFVALQCDRR